MHAVIAISDSIERAVWRLYVLITEKVSTSNSRSFKISLSFNKPISMHK